MVVHVRPVEGPCQGPGHQVRAKLGVAHNHVQHLRAIKDSTREQLAQTAKKELGLVRTRARVHVQPHLPDERERDR